MPEKPAFYSFLPFYRTGLASAVDAAAPGDRAALTVGIDARIGAGSQTFTRTVDLLGPGDILGIEERAIVRLDPRVSSNDFEANFLASIDFFDEDFVWRYSPRPPQGAGRTQLIPWIALIVLEAGEYKLSDQGTELPRVASIIDGSLLPPPEQQWAWAHTHLSGVSADIANPAATYATLTQSPARGCSRLIASRHLRPERSYRALVVPVFEAGRRAGLLGATPRDGAFAWDNGPNVLLPVYFEWSFRTAPDGDFKSLARRLHPHPADPTVGRRPMNTSKPLEGVNVPAILNDAVPPKPVLHLEGALEVPGAQPSAWPQPGRDAFRTWLADFINLGETWKVDAASGLDNNAQLPNGTKLPIVLPPAYGRWHANIATLDVAQTETRWLEAIDLDPRNRVAAAFGTLVVQKNQEDFMARAWSQYGALFEVNRTRHRAQFYRELLTATEAKHFTPLADAALLATSSLVHARVRTTVDASLTVRGLMDRSALPSAAIAPVFRRVLRRDGAIARRFTSDVAPVRAIVEAVATKRVAIAEPLAPPSQRLSLATPPAAPPGVDPTVANATTWEILQPLIVAYLELTDRLVQFFPQLRVATQFLRDLLAALGARRTLSAAGLTVDAVTAVRSAPRWSPTTSAGEPRRELRPEDLAPSARDGAFSFIADAFRQAAINANEALTIPVGQPVPRAAFDVTASAKTIRAGLSPYFSVSERVRLTAFLPAWVQLPQYDPLEVVMAHPQYDDATYEYLKKISQDYVVPNLATIANNTVTLLETNWSFIESFLVGLNHEMARELLWRGYPTDQRGSYFRQFWSVKGIPGAHDAQDRAVESFRDIHPIHGWRSGGALTKLGANRPVGRPIGKNIVLVVRGDLLRRYPNTRVYAVPAIDNPAGSRPDAFPHLTRRPDETRAVSTIFEAQFQPDVYCFGFDLQETQVRGTSPPSLGWYFVLAERFGEPHFGLDNPEGDPPLARPNVANVDTFAWSDLVTAPGADYAKLTTIDLTHDKPHASASGIVVELSKNATWGADSADMATILMRVPYRLYFHANDLLKTP